MTPAARDRLRLALIASTVVAATLCIIFGIPRARRLLTPSIERVWVASAALGDRAPSVEARAELQGTPVTLYAIVEARPFLGSEPVLYGRPSSVVLEPGAEAREVRSWKDWWEQPEFLWFKVEPGLPFANEGFDPDFDPDSITWAQNYQVSWGFGWSHAADVQASGDAFPEWDTGTMRFAVRAVVRDLRDRIVQRAESPGADAIGADASGRTPHRVTIEGGEDAFGRMLGFAGLPYVPLPGSAAERESMVFGYLGGTILDFWLAGRRLAGSYEGPLVDWDELPEVAVVAVDEMFLATDGTYYWTDDPLRPVTWHDVSAGDLVAIEDHVGVLWEDRGPGGGGDGLLNRWDRALEAYFEPLRDTALGDAFVSGITVYRLREIEP